MRVETIKFNEFISGEYKQKKVKISKAKKKAALKAGVALTAGILSLAFNDVSIASAGVVESMATEKVIKAFSPLIDLVQALSYPIGLVMMLGGGLFVMIGNQEKGMSMIQRAGMGYILVQMLPILMDLLVEIAKSI